VLVRFIGHLAEQLKVEFYLWWCECINQSKGVRLVREGVLVMGKR